MLLLAENNKLDTLNNFILQHFPAEAFNGRVIIGSRKPGQAPYKVKAVSIKNLIEAVNSINFVHQDYYITANSFSGVEKNTENLFALHNIVIDIDCHTLKATNKQLNDFMEQLDEEVFNVNLIPGPNTVVYTGRGIQLWWSIEAISAKKCLFMYDKVKSYYIEALQQHISNLNNELFKLDAGAASNDVGYFRFPGSYNTASKSYGTFITRHNRIINIVSAYSLLKEKENAHKATKNTSTDFFLFKNPFTLGLKRTEQLYKLRALRNDNECVGMRNNYCFIIYNALIIIYPHEVAYKRLRQFNNGFSNPLKEQELKSSISTAKKKLGYKLTNAWIIKQLAITDNEQQKIGICIPKTKYETFTRIPNYHRDEQAREKKRIRNEEIVKLAKEGYTQQAIADELNCCPATIRNVLRKTTYNRKQSIKKRVQKLLKTKTNAEIAKTLNVSVRTVQRIKKSLIKQTVLKKKTAYTRAPKFRINARKFQIDHTRQKAKNTFYICFALSSPPSG